MFKRIDESQWLASQIERLSNVLARRRGLPVVIGIILIVASLVLQTIDTFSPSEALKFVGLLSLHLGLLGALIGLLLAEPLGK